LFVLSSSDFYLFLPLALAPSSSGAEESGKKAKNCKRGFCVCVFFVFFCCFDCFFSSTMKSTLSSEKEKPFVLSGCFTRLIHLKKSFLQQQIYFGVRNKTIIIIFTAIFLHF